jgi:hypothetical protein
MQTIRLLMLGGLLALLGCSSSPTDPDVNGRSVTGSIVVPGHQSQGSNEPCESMGRLARKCVRK